MKKIILSLFAAVLFSVFCQGSFAEEVKRIKGGKGERTIDSYSATYSFSVPVQTAKVSAKQGTDSNNYLLFSFDKEDFTTDAGKPKLPFITEYVYLPQNAEGISLSIVNSAEEQEEIVYPIYPVEQITWVQGQGGINYETPVFTIDRNFYDNFQVFYPETKVELGAVADIRGVRFVPIKIYPIQFNPSTQKINLIQDITLKLTWTQKFSTNSIPPSSYGANFNTIINGLKLHNFNQDLPLGNTDAGAVNRPTDFATGIPTDYLIITADDFYNSDSIGDLADYRASVAGGGYNVSIVRTQDIYDNCPGKTGTETPDQLIKLFIRYVYDHWNGTNPPVEIVLLAGDATTARDENNKFIQLTNPNLVPAHLSTYTALTDADGDGELDRIATDYWYSCLARDFSITDPKFYADDSDILADVLIGRFPAKSETELQNIVNKTINYETLYPGEWRSKIELFSGFDRTDGQLGESMTMINNIVNNDLIPYPLEAEADFRNVLPDGLSGREQYRTIMKDRFNQGRQLTVVSMHGSRISWADGTVDNIFCGSQDGVPCNVSYQSDIPDLTNNTRPTVILSATCQNVWFDDVTFESLGENFVEDYDTGAVAFFGATRDIIGVDARELVDSISNKVFSEHNYILGSAILQVKSENAMLMKNILTNLLGDPALNIGKMLQPTVKSDLTCQIINYETTPKEVTLHTKVKNNGSSTLNNVLIQLFNGNPDNGGEGVTEVRIPAIEPNQEKLQDIVFTIPSSWAMGITLFLVVDGNNEIDESYEENNTSEGFYFYLASLTPVFVGSGSNPKIHGNKIVYSKSLNGRSDIYLRDLGSDGKIETCDGSDRFHGCAELNITGVQYDDSMLPRMPAIYSVDGNNKIVWNGLDEIEGTTNRVYVCDALGDQIFDPNDFDSFEEISQHAQGSNFSPAISGNKAVWSRTIPDNQNRYKNIYFSDAGENGIFDWDDMEDEAHEDNSSDQIYPDISNQRIVWQDKQGGNYNILVNDLGSQTTTAIATVFEGPSLPKISGDKIVWQDDRNGNGDIFLYDLSQGREYQVTANSGWQYWPAIYGNKIVWLDLRDESNDYYVYDLGPDARFGTSDDIPEKRVAIERSIMRSKPSIFENKLVYSEGGAKVTLVNLDEVAGKHLYVPQHYPTIQTAIDASTSGNTIHVMPGTYTEQIDFKGKNIYLWAEKGAGLTTIQSSGTTVSFHSGETSGAVLDGFTITSTSGNAVSINGASPTLKNNNISASNANSGGIQLANSSAIIDNNKIINCAGYGIKITGSSTPEISNNIIKGNQNSAIYALSTTGKNLIHHNLITNNSGYAVRFESSNGGAIGNETQVFNNTISNNPPGGIKFVSSNNFKVKNNIISSNGTYGIYVSTSTGIENTYNDIYNQTYNTYGISDGTGVIHLDPKFDGSSYLLRSDSPCKNTGDPAINDIDGSRSDIGAYFYPNATLTQNNSFEIDTGVDFYPNWSLDDAIYNNNLADGWTFNNFGVMDSLMNYGGIKSMKINVNNDRGFSAQDIPIQPNKTYRVSGFVKTDCADENCNGTILTECMDATHTNIWGYGSCKLNTKPSEIKRLYGDNDWTKIEFDVTSDNPNAQFVRTICYNTPNNPYENPPDPSQTGTGTVWCDSVNVVEAVQ